MKKDLVERNSAGLHYYVDISTASDIYFEKDTFQKLSDDNCIMSISNISLYIREHSKSYLPILLTWEMTSRCNLNCPFCYIRNNKITDITFDEVKSMIDFFVSKGLFEVYMSGGECLLLGDFLKIYKYFKTKGVFVTVFTNGFLINDEILKCWEELPPSSVEITLYDDNIESKPFENLLVLKSKGIHVLPKFTFTTTTIPYYKNVRAWTNANNLPLNVDSSLYDGVDPTHSDIKKRFSVDKKVLKEFFPTTKKYYSDTVGFRTALSCNSTHGIVQISPNFTMSLCNKMDKRWDLRKDSPKKALHELQELINKYKDIKINGCNGCIYSKDCSMCLVNAEQRQEELFVPEGYCENIKRRCLGIL